jgi:hypothetical protein
VNLAKNPVEGSARVERDAQRSVLRIELFEPISVAAVSARKGRAGERDPRVAAASLERGECQSIGW